MEKKINKNIYRKDCIEKVVETYRQLADINIIDQENFCIIKIEKVDSKYKNIIKDEFCNYLLFEVKKCL